MKHVHRVDMTKHATENFKHSFSYVYNVYNDLPHAFKYFSLDVFRTCVKVFLLNAQLLSH